MTPYSNICVCVYKYECLQIDGRERKSEGDGGMRQGEKMKDWS